MKKFALSFVVAVSLSNSTVMAADMAVKAPPAPAPSPWDIAITGALMSDYNFRGVTQSNHQPSLQFGLEPRYNFSKDLQGYFGVSGESIDFPNRAAAEIDL
ncbi:MAG TPA: TorF family putative porin, partial [Xanthobacteraceae bacterium]|nr:TorF family putative porin [Xanthobacteraceae bacterium]